MSTARIIALAAVLLSCHSKSKLDDLGAGPPPGVAASEEMGSNASAKDKGAPKREPVTAEALQPMIHELGLEHALPTSIVIEVAAPIVDYPGRISALSAIKIKPEIPGRLTYTNVSELTFT